MEENIVQIEAPNNNDDVELVDVIKALIMRVKSIEQEIQGMKPPTTPEKIPEKPEEKACVSIKFGDVAVTVEGASSTKAREDATTLFGMLEEKYLKNWEKKLQTEPIRYG